ncbi:hypothetical protein BS17DRAFT_783437 [Gyrodon lividus]|nr:hypothetical protein BS17DRAFT_783437 [Gyrodon lividus]
MAKDQPSIDSIIINDHPQLHLPCISRRSRFNIPDELFPIKLGFTMCSTAPAS